MANQNRPSTSDRRHRQQTSYHQTPGRIIGTIEAVLVILGRDAIGKPHPNHVLWSVGLYISGFVIIVSTIRFTFAVDKSAVTGHGTCGLADGLTFNSNSLLVGIFIVQRFFG